MGPRLCRRGKFKILPFLRRHVTASMGPRLCRRGKAKAIIGSSKKSLLQWGHAFAGVERMSPCGSGRNGPALQWGHAFAGVESASGASVYYPNGAVACCERQTNSSSKTLFAVHTYHSVPSFTGVEQSPTIHTSPRRSHACQDFIFTCQGTIKSQQVHAGRHRMPGRLRKLRLHVPRLPVRVERTVPGLHPASEFP